MKKTTKKTDIDKYLQLSNLAEIVELLQKDEIDDVLMIYIDKEDKVRVQGTMSLLESLGILELGKGILNNIAWDE